MRHRERPSFDRYYEELFAGRWPALKEALLASPAMVSLSDGLRAPYYLDRASIVAARALRVRPGERVLDLCAAPGGKSLILALAAGPAGSLTANDRSSERRARLRRVLAEHLPPELLARVRVTGHDASRWGLHERGLYDRVLADVPCSSERHLVASPRLADGWSPARTRHLAIQAYAILAAALDAARAGGVVLYATCALSPLENDEVIAKLLERRGPEVGVDEPAAVAVELAGGSSPPLAADPAPSAGIAPADPSPPPPHAGEATARRGPPPFGALGRPSEAEATRFGLQLWPDRADGMGPIYFARLHKCDP